MTALELLTLLANADQLNLRYGRLTNHAEVMAKRISKQMAEEHYEQVKQRAQEEREQRKANNSQRVIYDNVSMDKRHKAIIEYSARQLELAQALEIATELHRKTRQQTLSDNAARMREVKLAQAKRNKCAPRW